MERSICWSGLHRAIHCSSRPAKRRLIFRSYASQNDSITTSSQDIRAASPIRFASDPNQFSRPQAERLPSQRTPRSDQSDRASAEQERFLRRLRIVPASPSYFTATPKYTDDLLQLSELWRRHQLRPQVEPGKAPRVAWKTLAQYRTELDEDVRVKGYNFILGLLRRLNTIHPSVLPVAVERALLKFRRSVQPHTNRPKPIVIDDKGRARAVGRRKSSNARVFLVEGDGECLVNGKSLSQYFGRVHDRESALWALKATQRLDKYNAFVLVQGGGTTGQAEAITLGLAKALLAHEPDLKPALRRAGCITRDIREVERKKPGKVKARKMPAWVKR